MNKENIKINVMKFLMYPSKVERDKRFQEKYDKIVQNLRSKEREQFNAEYVKTKSKYEYKKNMLTMFIISLVLFIITCSWGLFTGFVENVSYLILDRKVITDPGNDVISVAIVIAVILIFSIIISLLVIIYLHMKDVYNTYQYLLIIEGEQKNG